VFSIIDSISKSIYVDSKTHRTNGNAYNAYNAYSNINSNNNNTNREEVIEGTGKYNKLGSKTIKTISIGTTSNIKSSVLKLKNFVNSLIKKDDNLKKKIEDVLQHNSNNETSDNEDGILVDGFCLNIQKAGDKLADFSNPFYIPSGAPETLVDPIDWKDPSTFTKYIPAKPIKINHGYEEIEDLITKRILMGEGFDSLIEDKSISNLLLASKSKKVNEDSPNIAKITNTNNVNI
jgi:hypothetical protein